MVLDIECRQGLGENFCLEEEQKVEKNFPLKNNDKAWKFEEKLTFWNGIKKQSD